MCEGMKRLLMYIYMYDIIATSMMMDQNILPMRTDVYTCVLLLNYKYPERARSACVIKVNRTLTKSSF